MVELADAPICQRAHILAWNREKSLNTWDRGAMVMWQNNQSVNSSDTTSNDIPLDRGAKIILWGSAISILGDAIQQVIGGAISIEEARISAQQQKATRTCESTKSNR